MRGPVVGAVLALLAGCGATLTIPSLPAAPGAAPPGTSRLYSPAAHAFQFVAGPVRRGERAERFELRAGDCGGTDCGAFRARAQVDQLPEAVTARLGRDAWVGFSFLNGSIARVERASYLGTVLAEWKLQGEQPALFRLLHVAAEDQDWAACGAACPTSGPPSDDVVVELSEMAGALGWGEALNGGRVCRLWDMEANLGAWVDVVVNTNFAPDASGYLRVWVDDELRCDWRGPLVSPAGAQAAAPGPRARRGVFTSFTRRWAEATGGAPTPTLVAFFDEWAEGRARGEVDPRLREARGGPALD